MADRFESVFDRMDQEKGVVTAPTSSVEGNVVAASPDRFESVFDQMDKVKQEQDGMSWTAGKTIPAAEAVDVIGLSDHFKVAPDFAARNAKQLRAQKRVEDSDFALVKNSAPVVSKWATENPYNSSLAMDDIKNLAKIEEMVKDHVEDNSMVGFMQKALLDAVPVLGEYRKFKRDVEKSPLAQYGLAQAGLTAARIPGGLASTGALGVNVSIRDKEKAPFVQSAVDAALPGVGAALGAIGKIDEAVNPEGGIVEPPRVLLDNPLTRYLEDKMKSIDIPEMNASVTEEIASGNYRKAGKALAYQFAANAPTQALIIASTLINPAAGIGAIVGVGAGTAGTATKEAQDAGLSPLAAQTRGAFHGAAEAGLEYVGTFGILKHWSGALAKSFGKDTARKVMSDMLKTMTYAFAGEANEEASTEAVQYATDVLTGYEKEPFSLRTMGIRMADAAIQGGVMGLGMTGPSAIGGGIARSEGIKNATRVKNFYNALGDSIESTKLRQSLPEKTYEIVSRLTKDGPVENIFIPTEAIETYAQSAKVDALEFTHSIGALESYKAAKEGSGVMKIPMAEWVKNVVGSEAYKGLANDIKFSPNEFTVNESIRFREQMQKVAEERAPEMESIGSVYDDFRTKVMAVGATPEEADAHAMLVAERERIRGQILGEDPLALYKKDNFEINRFQTPDQIAQVEDVQFNQSLPDDWQTGPARAVFRGWQDQGSFGDPFPLYNIIGEHPKARSTVAETTLKSMGIDVPATPAFDEWAKSAPVQALQQSAIPNDQELDAAFARSLDEFSSGKREFTFPIPVGQTPAVLTAVGAKHIPLVINADTVAKVRDKHGIGIEQLKGLPESLRDPLMVFESATQPNSLVVLTEMSVNDNPVIVAVHLNNKAGRYDVNKIVSVHGRNKNGIGMWVKDGLLRYWDQEKATAWLQSAGLQLPMEGVTPSTNRILSKADIVNRGEPLFQAEKGKDPRAQIRFGKDSINIDLFKNADLSSLVHELWHVFAKQIGQDLETVKAKPEGDLSFVQRQFVQDGDAILKWVGAESFATLTTEQHEQIARAGELFLREGKAPSSTLRGAFARFREWLLMVYRTVAQLDVQLTPEVREVFSRLLASQDEIKIAQEELNIAPLFADAKSVGMTNAQAEKYAEALAEAKAAGEEELATKIMAEMKRREMKPYLDRKAEIEAEATRYVDTHIDYIALSVLQRGKFPDGTPLPDGEIPAKLSRKAIVDQYGEERLSRLPKPYVYSRQGGITPDEAAIKFGYPSGDALLTTLENIRPKNQVVAEIVDSKLKAEFGDMKTDGTIAKEAMDAVHNEKRAQLLKKEMDHLVSEEFSTFKNIVRRVSRPVPSVEAVREQAQDSIRGMSVRDIYPSMYQRAESKASREAVEAMLKGDMETAFTAKLKERLNHELYRAAVDAKDSVDGMVKYFKRFDDNDVRARIGKAGGTYLEQIEGLLERFQFKKSVTLKELDRRKSLVQWVMEQKEAGVQVDIPQELLNEANRLHYKDTPYGTLVDLEETIKMIEHTAVFKNKLLANERARTVEEAVSDISASIAAHHTVDNKPVSIEPTLKERFLEKPSEFLASHAKMEFIAQILDGDKKLGPMYRHVIEPLLKAGDNEANKIHDASARLEDIFSVYTKTERATWYYKKIHIPALGQYLYKPTILAMAMNQGNPYNQEALLEGLRGLGYVGWTQDHVDAALDTLDERDIKVVNDVHALLESYWPEASALEKRVNGVAPEKVQGVPMQLKNGRINGGYYPIKFDHNRSWISMKRLEEELAKGQMGQHWAKAMTKQGHLKERTNTGGNPLRLDLGIINEHIQNVVHDVTHREAVIDVHRIINENEFRDMIVKTIGMNFYKEFQPWLNSIAGQVNTESISWLESLASHAKKGVTVVALGLKVSSGLMQTAGYGNTFKELGEKYALVGLKKMGKDGANLKALWDEISEKSVEMKYRLSTYDRDVRETMNKLNVTGTKRGIMSVPEIYTSDAYKAYFGFIGMMDLAVSIPSWLGAYEKAMDGKVKGIDKANEKDAILYADQVVRMTQSANRVMDLARIQRGNQVQKLFTMFYSQMSIQYNQFLKTGMMVGHHGGKSDVIRAFIYMMFVQAVITDFIRGNGSGSDDDKWWARIAKDMAFIPLETMIVLRDIASGLDRFGYSGSPAFDVGKTLTGTAKSLGQRVFGDKEELTEADMKKIVKSAGYVFALPTGQAWKTAEYLHAWMLGNEEPDNVMQGFWEAFVTGKTRK